MTVDTFVALNLAAESVADLNSRFLITLPTLRIPKGENEAEGTIIFTPIDDEIETMIFRSQSKVGPVLGASGYDD